MNNEAEQFAYLVHSLRALLHRYLEHTQDAEENPLIHMAMLQVMMSLEFLDRVGQNDPNAMALLQDLLVQFQERASQMVKH